MNKFFKNFSKYLLIASLGFASTQAVNTDEEMKKLDKIISKQNKIIAMSVFDLVGKFVLIYVALSFFKVDDIWSRCENSWLSKYFKGLGDFKSSSIAQQRCDHASLKDRRVINRKEIKK